MNTDRRERGRTSTMNKRQGFTIVELLVAMALIVLIMAILSEAFVAGLDGFRALKAVGDLQERLRVAAAPLRRDLLSRHFDQDQKISALSTTPGGAFPSNIQGGFFRIDQGSAPGGANYPFEGYDTDGQMCFRAVDHRLSFTVRPLAHDIDRGRREDWLTARLNVASPLTSQGPVAYQQANQAISNAAEVMWFLYPTGETAGTTPLYSLQRRQRLLPFDKAAFNNSAIPATQLGAYAEVSVRPVGATLVANDLADVAVPANRTCQPIPLGLAAGEDPTWVGDDLVLTDVVSFEVQVLRPGHPDFEPISAFVPSATVAGNYVYDTTDNSILRPAAPYSPNIQLRGIKVTIRIWDFKSQTSRQITVIEEL